MSLWSRSLSAKAIFLVLATSSVLALGACANTDQEETTTSTGAAKLTDSELETRIQAALDSDDAVRAADLNIDANASENRATISGTTSTEAVRERALELARTAQPGIVLDVKIDVKPPDVAREEWTEEYSRSASTRAKAAGDTVTDSLDDTWIHSKIVAKLIGDTDVAERKINVDVEKKVVTLRGTVASAAEKAEAARIAKETNGVVRVINQLKVQDA